MTETWRPLAETALRDLLGHAQRVVGVSGCSGGCIDTAYVLTLANGEQVFAKRAGAEALPRFRAELHGLQTLAASATVRVPQVIGVAGDTGHALLLLEYLELAPLHSADSANRLAEALAALHAIAQPQFGDSGDSFLGQTLQSNRPTDAWPRFFAEERLRPQLVLAQMRGFGGELSEPMNRLIERLPALFLDYRPRPARLHGDLWHGNTGQLADGTPVVFDPASYCGDRDADLAMAELFGGFPAEFYLRYRQCAGLAEGYEQRKTLYNLYHILNHLNHFGRGYLNQAVRMATQLGRELAR